MLAELKPSKEHTGGAWYTDQTFDAEFVNVLKQQCVQFVVRQVRILVLREGVKYDFYCAPQCVKFVVRQVRILVLREGE